MADKRFTNSFKSYVGFDDDSLNTSNDESFSEQLTPRCLPGEMMIAEAQNVLMFSPVTENKQGKSGVLFVTNFKLSFVTTEEHAKEVTNTFFNPIVPMETASLIDDDVVQPTLLKNYFCNTLCNITLDSGNVSPKGATYGEIITENDIINSDFIICNSENQIEFIQQSLATDKAVTNEEVMKEKSIINDDLIVNNDHIQEDLAQQGSSSDNKAEMISQENLLLGEYDVCLSNVDALYHMGEKKRRLLPGRNMSERVKGLVIVCKNMKILTFSFKFSPVGHGRNLTNALLHHAFPKRHQLLFAYDFREPYYTCPSGTFMFRDPGEWGRELARTGSVGWKLSSANKEFKMSTSLPEWIVAPSSASEIHLLEAARHFRAGRPPLWCWSSTHGAALVRMADIQPFITDRVKENTMLETVRKSHPRLAQPKVLDLSKDLASPRDLQISYIKLREICSCESVRQFWVQDNHLLSLLESSKWLQYVSNCLARAMEVARSLYAENTVVLQEGDGRDMCAVVASLAQLLIDPYFRSINGFQSLIQKEWVTMGHPFCTRLSHVYNIETQEAPVFLLFLDCVWQLLQQFPADLQMTETYLTTLWDSAHMSIFDTFLFDCERDRKLAAIIQLKYHRCKPNTPQEPNNPLTLRSVWDWGEQFSDRDVALFVNPLYAPAPPLRFPGSYPPLQVETAISALQLWSQCYFRFIPITELIGGGKPQVDLSSRLLVSQIEQLEREIEQHSPSNQEPDLQIGLQPPPLESLNRIGSFFPFSRRANSGPVSAALLVSSLSLNTSFQSSEVMLDSQSMLNAPD